MITYNVINHVLLVMMVIMENTFSLYVRSFPKNMTISVNSNAILTAKIDGLSPSSTLQWIQQPVSGKVKIISFNNHLTSPTEDNNFEVTKTSSGSTLTYKLVIKKIRRSDRAFYKIYLNGNDLLNRTAFVNVQGKMYFLLIVI